MARGTLTLVIAGIAVAAAACASPSAVPGSQPHVGSGRAKAVASTAAKAHTQSPRAKAHAANTRGRGRRTTGKVPTSVAAQVGAARKMLTKLHVATDGTLSGYDRTGEFGEAWVDVNANGCSTRDDILNRDLVATTHETSCYITAGTLHDPYTGRPMRFTSKNPTAVQIDHVVPLALAWQLGARNWSQGKRVAFANDPSELLAVDGTNNERKGDSGPDQWLPPNRAYDCTYVIRFTRVASLYGLRISPGIRTAIRNQLNTCRRVAGSPATLRALPSRLWSRAASLGGSTSSGSARAGGRSSARGSVYYANCDAVRAAGKAPLYRGQPGYRAGLDGDDDGVACES